MNNFLRNFSFKSFAIAVAICAIIAGLVSWFTLVKFWIAFLIALCAMLINGWVASIEDRDRK